MGVFGIPMIDGDPVELRTEIARCLVHQFAGKTPQAFQFAGIIRRNDEPKMMPAPVAALHKSPAVRIIAGSIEEFTWRSVAGDAVALEITDMGSQRPRRAHPAYHTRLDHGAAGAVVEEPRCGKARRTAAAERGASLGSAAWETACFLSGFEGLREKGFCLGRAGRADAAWTDAEIVVAAHSARRKVSKTEKEQCLIANDKLRCIFAMFGACLKLLTFPNRPTGRTLRLLSCHPR